MNSGEKPRLDIEAEQTLLNYLMYYMHCKSFEERRYIQQQILRLEEWIQELKGDSVNDVEDVSILSEYDFSFGIS